MTIHTVDAIIIGAGHHGLVAGNMLVDAGWKVLICEATSAPGGAVRSAELAAPGYISDTCSAFLPLAVVSPVFKALDLASYGLRWRHAPAVLAHVFPDNRGVVLSRDIETTAASLAQFARADADTWRAEFTRWQQISQPLLSALLQPFPPVTAGAGLLRRLGVADSLRFARMAMLPVARYGQENFAGEGAQVLLAGTALHTDLNPQDATGALYGWLLSMLGQQNGFPVPEGGAQALTDALVRRFVERGGQLSCDQRIVQVLVAGGRAVGVQASDGELLRAKRAVIADVPAPHLFTELIPAGQLPSRVLDDFGRFQWDRALVKLDWALRASVPWQAEAARGAGTVHLGTDLEGMTTLGIELARGKIPRKPFILAGQMSTADPSRSPAGTETVWAYTHVPRNMVFTRSKAQKFADRIEATFEQHAPGFRDLIVGRALRWPGGQHSDYGQYHAASSSLNLGTSAVHQQLIFRPIPGLGRADTPVDRLFLAGASAHPGGGVHGAAGANAARAALARNGWFGDLYGMAIRGANRLIYS